METKKKSEFTLAAQHGREISPEEVEATAILLFKWWRLEHESRLLDTQCKGNPDHKDGIPMEGTTNE